MSGSLLYTQVVATNDPTAQIQLFGVNDSGVAVGDVIASSGGILGFVAGSTFQDTFNFPSGGFVEAFAINNSGEIVGDSLDGLGDSVAFSVELSDLSGATAISGVPANASANGIDANGDIVGVLSNSEQFQVVNGSFSVINNPTGVAFNAVSENGEVALIVLNSAVGGFNNLLATPTGAGGGPLGNLPSSFEGQGVNDAGQVVGFDSNGQNGFFRDTGGTVYAVDVPGSYATSAEGINDNGEIVGYYRDNFGNFHGFTTTVAAVKAADDVLAAACYCAGTLIATENGDILVESLQIGDKLLTGSGALRPIKWIGRRSYGGRFIAGSKDILPICIKAGALDDNVPRRDLWISPHHAMLIDGLLIEARDLVNGISIVQAERVDKVSYFHIELETHDVIVAEGALSETFMDDDSRGMFQNAHEFHVLYPDASALPTQYCAPRVEDGYELEAVRQRTALRAAAAAPVEPRIRIFRRRAKAG